MTDIDKGKLIQFLYSLGGLLILAYLLYTAHVSGKDKYNNSNFWMDKTIWEKILIVLIASSAIAFVLFAVFKIIEILSKYL